MKSIHSEAFYREFWGDFMKPVIGEHYMNLESELEEKMKFYAKLDIPAQHFETFRKLEAEKVVKHCREVVLQDREIVYKINNGTASFGYTTASQERAARKAFVERFEVNCLQLRDFRSKYGV